MKKYNHDDVVNNVWLDERSVEEVVRDMWDLSGDNDEWNVKDDLKDYKDWDFTNGKKYVVRATIGSRGCYEGVEIVREGEVLLEKDLWYGSDFWMEREYMLKELKEDLDNAYISCVENQHLHSKKEEYEKEVKFWKEGSNRDILEDSLMGCINESDDGNSEWNEESQCYYYVVNRLKRWEDQGAYRHIKGN